MMDRSAASEIVFFRQSKVSGPIGKFLAMLEEPKRMAVEDLLRGYVIQAQSAQAFLAPEIGKVIQVSVSESNRRKPF
jgi:hypothetical protein